jgi:hypothetical protein
VNSRIEPKIRAVLATGMHVTKYTMADLAPCHQRVAQRVLTRLHREGEIHISRWASSYQTPIPVYVVGPGKDKAKPKPLTPAEISQMYRNRHPEVRIRDKAKRQLRERKPARKLVQSMPMGFGILTTFGARNV